jgi:spore germination protein GerM
MSDDIVMEDVYAKLAKAREKKAAAKQEQVAAHKLKHNASNRKSYNKMKKSKAPKASKKAPSNGDDKALKNCPPSNKQEVCGNADSGDEPPELLVRPGDEEDNNLERKLSELLVRPGDEEEMDYNDFVAVAQVLTQMTTLL